ncbi:hypothetical protein DMP15_10490 [Pseudonocardia sp. UM4_GMWB1]|nr:hypothetical protein [Pseudonocardia sp. SID8383]
MVHANAPLSERGRLRLARLIVEGDVPIAQAAARFQVAWPTAERWVDRYASTVLSAWPIVRAARTTRCGRRRRRWCAGSCTCAGRSAWARSRSPTGSGSHPRLSRSGSDGDSRYGIPTGCWSSQWAA